MMLFTLSSFVCHSVSPPGLFICFAYIGNSSIASGFILTLKFHAQGLWSDSSGKAPA
jgi:hypothetical protein